ncbi:unnamed protein product [Pelagomonas calceolata]|uniref:Uncharacterized protein n=1 Tax=Pelagomonas calceolata TaxID=35677 RepID=A0A8J2T086_9STRA|nr:unnamed protein product [Pelagomonas calceolata]
MWSMPSSPCGLLGPCSANSDMAPHRYAMRTRVLFMSTSSLSKVSLLVSPVVSYKNWSSPPWNLTWMTTIFFGFAALRLFHGFSWGASTASTRRKSCARC